MNYSELTLHYFQTAVAAGVLTGPDVYRGAAGSRARGTWVQFDVQVNSGIIRAARFLAFACPHTIAVAAWVAEHAVGPVSRAALPESVQDLSERFAVPVEKRGRLLLIEDAWLAAVSGALQRCCH
jgi:NifU-like protein involved in Fe-S cluster formation